MSVSVNQLVGQQPDLDALNGAAVALATALIGELNRHPQENAPAFTESRARALLQGGGLLDEGSAGDFARLMGQEAAVRVALSDLLAAGGLGGEDGLDIRWPVEPAEAAPPWQALIIAAFAWKADFPLYQLDPSAPPAGDSPAGQLLRRAAHFIRRQVQLSATERARKARQLAFVPAASGADASIAPLPPHYRPPIPVRYPEVARETLHIDPDDLDAPPATPGAPLTIDEEDVAPRRRPALRIERGDVARPARVARPTPRRPRPAVSAVVGAGNSLTTAVRHLFRREPLTTTRLRVTAHERPDGNALYGLQVRVSCAGIRSHVAGITDRNGRFLCELPVPHERGLTYDVALTWPREHGGDVEKKSITLHSDRTEFALPFYRHLGT